MATGLIVFPTTPRPDHDPPAGLPPARVIDPLLIQVSFVLRSSSTTGTSYTVIFCDIEFTQPLASVYVYVIGCVPSPAAEASKLVPVTPIPENTPPAGNPPDKASDELSSQSSTCGRDNETEGRSYTVISSVTMAEQPLASVNS